MARTTRKELRNVFKSLDDEDRERVLDFAERLAGDDTPNSPESLVDDDPLPSYQAAAGEDMFKRKKKEKEREKRRYGDNATF
ncbi:hypothetical protein [Haloarcula laminariae]|uniref:hypothetical protein n=1 Tax=Haloarcula laminariae TaxID=2961577 RepID=UPI0021C8F308|nr:hypothetical protein [Halomicroarcula laminariae]